ncbi:hypothetical protein E4U19_000976 [Claviceps sp. Clav32 group G5]|nr:hypothetical protein E4U19_000976 [Claviceps sp. Clav32 group G5]KAG6046514.1 hypothetical protein E4U39_001277 [Claviceps sp. Clav50 group G5]
MRSSLVLFGLAAFALADLDQNANEVRDVAGSKVDADSPSRVLARAVTCCSNYPDTNVCQCWSDLRVDYFNEKVKVKAPILYG